jgi:hypothetical protein
MNAQIFFRLMWLMWMEPFTAPQKPKADDHAA